MDSVNVNKPSRIEFEFKHKSGKCYAYGFVFDNDIVYEEWLYQITSNTDTLIFNRNNGKFEDGIKYYSEEDESFIKNIFKGVRDN